ncbi:MAG: mannose-6-phosphate isomerase [Bradyrhizobium sp.]|jgi:mannose-6-phosphate isomerase|nr:mannose-6-phosphate isomerase [Bradyrhizobium sp.]
MAIEHAAVQVVRKPWGVADLEPWSRIDGSGDAVGELWFQRVDQDATIPTLLLKLLFTSEPLSIQVHPDDAFAHSIGLPNGKTEAWYILAALPDARIAVGLKRDLTPQELRAAIKDGSIAGLTQWRPAVKGDIIFVPAGTIHAIGAGIVLAEIQQRSDATFRLYDYGRRRELHEDHAVAVSDAGPVEVQSSPRRLTAERTALIANPHFVLERVDLPANSNWTLEADRETWMLVTEGQARIGATNTAVGDAIFVEADRAAIEVGPDGLNGLIAYPGPDPVMPLLRGSGEQMTKSAGTSAQRSLKSNEIVEVQT